MKRRLLSLCCALAVVTGMTAVSAVESQAASSEEVIDGSYLIHEDESIGYDTKLTRGVDLLVGYSKGVKVGPGQFYAGGSTVAAHTVKQVGLSVSVEKAQKGDTTWKGYRAWHKYSQNVDRVSSSKYLTVEGDYYYRVRCTHSANSDMSSSFTDGVYIPKP